LMTANIKIDFEIDLCQGKVEMSPFLQSRDVPFAKG